MPAFRPLVVALTALLALLLGPSAALAEGNYPPAPVRVVAGVVSPERVAVGEAVTFSGGGFAPGALLRLSVDGKDTGTTTADSAGAFSVSVTLDAAGERVLGASGLEPGGRVRVVSATVIVDGAQEPDTTPSLATSGRDIALPLLGGLGLVLVGATLVVIARRRRSQPRLARSML